uniref:Uncharacterized protein n=1 Tax=Anguilla anguilla TaxID=7936 RepID=A0A0E9S4B6_ANGAN
MCRCPIIPYYLQMNYNSSGLLFFLPEYSMSSQSPIPFYLPSLLSLSLGSSFFLLCEKPSRNRYFETVTHALKTHACHSNLLQCLPPSPVKRPFPINGCLSLVKWGKRKRSAH